ncbi:DUF4111 domain-containing protein [Propioniciclava sinopodophylli]|uniref:DUF4111 domain-containing protein n=1 Tax=Propioniciclava sinopodophylli TaxID=1837344 RepID=A0A4Q9KFZ8_9ACTN|nr:DUF4111 domain-containing protein [Propioniciclava sinopodophylli]
MVTRHTDGVTTLPDLNPLGDPVAFQLNVNGGLARPSVVQLAPDGPDAGSPNRVLNLARLVVLVEDGTWLSKQAGAQTLVDHHPEFADAVAEALRARTERRWMDPRLADPLSALLLDRLG